MHFLSLLRKDHLKFNNNILRWIFLKEPEKFQKFINNWHQNNLHHIKKNLLKKWLFGKKLMKNIWINMVNNFKLKKRKKKIISKIKISKKICKLKLIICKYLLNLKNLLLYIFNFDNKKLISLNKKHQIYHTKKLFKKLT